MSSIFVKQIPASVRDVFVLSLRRAPAPHSNGHSSDSLRRLVLQRNTLKTALDGCDTSSPRHNSLRRISTDVSNTPSESLPKQNGFYHNSQPAQAQSSLRRSRSAQDLVAASDDAISAAHTEEELLEDMWFDQVMNDLAIKDTESKEGIADQCAKLPALNFLPLV